MPGEYSALELRALLPVRSDPAALRRLTEETGEDVFARAADLQRALSVLPVRMRFVCLAVGERDLRQEDVAALLGVSQAQVSRLFKESLCLMQITLNAARH